MNLIDRYLSAVAQHLPEAQRDDITRELKANILDRLENLVEEQGRAITPADETAVLHELGHPQQVAAGFLPPQTLVSADWFPLFKQSLVYGFIFIVLMQAISFGSTLMSSGRLDVYQLAANIIHGCLLMFASVTGVFYLLSSQAFNHRFKPYADWKPEQLAPVASAWQRIKPSESATEFGNNLLALLLLQHPLWMNAEQLAELPLTFAAPILPWILPLSLWVAVAILFNLWNLRYSYWDTQKLRFALVLNLIGAALAFIIMMLPTKIVLLDNAPHFRFAFAVDNLITGVFLFAGCWYLYEVARNAYRLNLLRQIKS